MNSNTYRPGSMGEADAKSNKVGMAIFAGIFALLLLITLIPSGLFTHLYFSRAAGGWKVAGFLLALAWGAVFVYTFKDFVADTISQVPVIIGLVVIMALSLACLWGWNFSL